jgi:2',3'-cyclic-nucleotide 2'-phosphodiesterase
VSQNSKQFINVLCIGDVVGRPGRDALHAFLPSIQEEHDIDFTIANVENSAGGFGLTKKVYNELATYNIQAFTSGNHIYQQKDLIPVMNKLPLLIRPLNYPKGNPGVGYRIFDDPLSPFKVAVINLMGRVFIDAYDSPFEALDRVLPEIHKETNIVIVDFHAEATSEKQAFGWYADGRTSLVFGTHTHVQTSDERLLDQGTAYITDIGMVGPRDSIIGMDRANVIRKFRTLMPARFEVPKTGAVFFNGIVCQIDIQSGKAVSIKRISRS